MDTLGDVSKFRPWIYRIAYNTFVSSMRSARENETVDKAVGIASDRRADAAFEYQELYAALDRLPDRERTSMLLHYMDGYKTDEIAAITGMSPDAVRQHLTRGRVRLREILKK